MSLVLHYHPLSSFCHKVLIAIYETGAPVRLRHLDLQDAGERDAHRARWPLGKMPVLEDEASGRVLPETSIIIEHLQQRHPGPRPLLPADPEAQLDVRLWDRLSDHYVMFPLQAAVAAVIAGDAAQAAKAEAVSVAQLELAYGVLEQRLRDRTWLAGEDFSLADCAAAPALFYAGAVRPFAQDFPALGAYFARLLERPSVQRVLREAQPWIRYFPLLDRLPAAHRAAVER
ncbi:glutathione S-transferase family protein [Arenimonas terrae]|uniref:Glutathione S-transferase family protein n=1 Tax=Arenimonas terrae TaxID=2546226 RepID=A0A5C4RS98_9GAMM|nr:glutathione S-transferase family protein [Arenimonas terrae]TNJ33839.1 glutathione S-transferase family protein [Arenimonas terrae]